MTLLALVLIGFCTPFLLIWGGFSYLLLLPLGTVIVWLKPHWQKLSRSTRRTIRTTALWSASALLWITLVNTISSSGGSFR